jgi:hypothetical protein
MTLVSLMGQFAAEPPSIRYIRPAQNSSAPGNCPRNNPYGSPIKLGLPAVYLAIIRHLSFRFEYNQCSKLAISASQNTQYIDAKHV